VQISYTQGGKQKKITLQRANQKKKVTGGKTKLTHITGYQMKFLFLNKV
jgi:hypothetical protein